MKRENGNSRRYSQSRGTLPRIYFPKTLTGIPWKKIAANPKIGIVITEGEKKAAKACKEGLPTISIGGVWAWRSKKHGLASIPDFDLIEWDGREVRLCFDNDLMSNPLVIGALNALAHELLSRGAKVFVVHLPKGPGKIGLDDYLVKRSAASFLKLNTEEYAESASLWEFNEDVCYIKKLKAYYCFSLRIFFKTKADFVNAYENLSYQVAKTDGQGFKTLRTVIEWCKWLHRQEYEDVVFVPGGERVIDDKINTWEDWPIEPKQGPIKPFYDLLNSVFKTEPKLKAWFEKWAAFPLQNPGAKILNAVLLHSREQGVGKSFIGLILRDIYGPKHSITIEQDQLHSAFNPWAASKQFILGEEITGTNSRKDADRIKHMVTRETVSINDKYAPSYVLADCANYLLTSNHVDALFIDDHDRRFVVHEVKSKEELAFYKPIDKWRKNGGAAHLFWHLLNEVDTSGFDPRAPAPWTEAKQQMIDLSKSDLDLFAADLLANPDDLLKFQGSNAPCDIFTIKSIVRFAKDRTTQRPTSIATSKALRRVGFFSRVITNDEIGTKRLWPVCNLERWKGEENAKWVAEFVKNRRRRRRRRKYE